MITFKNQKIIRKVETLHDTQNTWFIQNKECMFNAMTNLSNGAFSLYMYLNSNQDYEKSNPKFELALSQKDFTNKTGKSSKTYHDAVKELIEKGYIKQLKENGNIYMFYENPDDKNKDNKDKDNANNSNNQNNKNKINLKDVPKSKFKPDEQQKELAEAYVKMLYNETYEDTISWIENLNDSEFPIEFKNYIIMKINTAISTGKIIPKELQ